MRLRFCPQKHAQLTSASGTEAKFVLRLTFRHLAPIEGCASSSYGKPHRLLKPFLSIGGERVVYTQRRATVGNNGAATRFCNDDVGPTALERAAAMGSCSWDMGSSPEAHRMQCAATHSMNVKSLVEVGDREHPHSVERTLQISMISEPRAPAEITRETMKV